VTELVSIVVPVLNGEKFLAASLHALVDFLRRYRLHGELVVVDDGSSDGTFDVIETVQRELAPDVTLLALRNEKNRGKGQAVRRGLREARGDYRLFTDADLTYPPENIKSVLDALRAGAELAIASRVHSESLYLTKPELFRKIYARHRLGRLFNALTRMLVLDDLGDTQAGLKGLTRRAVEMIIPQLTLDGFAFDVELLYLAQRARLGVVEVPVTFVYCRQPSTIALARDGARMLTDLAKIRWNELSGRYDSSS
jgi:dolichyl-phosphate beta-glucosyltransferase